MLVCDGAQRPKVLDPATGVVHPEVVMATLEKTPQPQRGADVATARETTAENKLVSNGRRRTLSPSLIPGPSANHCH